MTFEIYFSDLNENAQKELLDLLGIDSPSEMNWDSDFFPIAIAEFEDNEEEERN